MLEHEFSAPRTLEQNEAFEKKNGSLQEITRTMLKKIICQHNFVQK